MLAEKERQKIVAELEKQRLESIVEEEKKQGPMVAPSDSDDVDVEPMAKDNKTTNRLSNTGEVAKKSSKTDYYTESEPSPKKAETTTAKPGIDPVVWKQARVELKSLIENFGQNKYQSNSCTIKSL